MQRWPVRSPSRRPLLKKNLPTLRRQRRRLLPVPLRRQTARLRPCEGEAPEISTAEATALPDGPAQAADRGSNAESNTLTLHINARLVDVNVVALDKKGRPIADLKPENFEVYDNGVKQSVSRFTQANASTPGPPPVPAAPPAIAGDGQTFSNRAAKEAQSKAIEGNTIILLLDGSNLAWADFAVVREQTMRFLKSLPPNERVALYAMRYHGFEVLEEATTDHNVIASRLSKWGPAAQDLANGQDEEMRNRQQIETVHSPEDMLNVNGNYTLDPDTQDEALDPKLRELGSRPGPIAMTVLGNVARHLALLPGHKSLVWITSDNVLVDWTRSSITIEKSSKYIEPAALRTQEAMNNAQVSVYPLDASRLEANVINADIGNRNVELTPTFQKPPIGRARAGGPGSNLRRGYERIHPESADRQWRTPPGPDGAGHASHSGCISRGGGCHRRPTAAPLQ